MTGDQSIEGIEITSRMTLSCKTACSSYKDELAKHQTDDADFSRGHKWKPLQEEYGNVKRKKVEEEEDVANLEKNCFKMYTSSWNEAGYAGDEETCYSSKFI